MKLFLRALLLAILGLGAIGGASLWAFSALTGGAMDPQYLAVQTFLILAAFAFGAFALLQAKEDHAAYKKANKKPNHALNAAFILVALLVLVFAGYKAWQSTLPITVSITYLNGTTEQPIAGAKLYAADASYRSDQTPQTNILTTDAEGKTRLSVNRGSYYNIYEKPPKDVPGPSLGQIDTYGVPGTEYEMLLYAGESNYGYGGQSDTYTVRVIDSDGSPLASADVTFFTSTQTQQTGQTDERGEVSLEDNGYSPIAVFVSKEGYRSQTGEARNGDLTLVMLTPEP
ncbi:carboxypeptidase regulatory-like domain-containing protein [Candidatus Micrarchaeota archaeon]|nr:carboxypeptidase regulatory-like domain-containing protein [Candidatus Micrarchaeota archaeon]